MQQTEELLSALLDGELAPDDLDRLIESLDSGYAGTSPTMDAPMRWSMMGGVMRGRDTPTESLGLLAGINAALDVEHAAVGSRTVVPLKQSARPPRWSAQLTGFAAAASVALAVLLLPLLNQQSPGLEPSATERMAQTVPAAADVAARDASRATRERAVTVRREDQLNSFHIEYAGHRTAQGIGGPLGYARFAAHNADLRSHSPGR